ncbi:fimbria/pilus periplasmic chaperone [Zavarzinia sp. CC-PAN008]|uniref:fimbria/pilus periplasmic chaperone n=1 Tax=Zavarzinia sp. CC-PAN008 TaxID=3243332 RepID=UPI003F7456E5
MTKSASTLVRGMARFAMVLGLLAVGIAGMRSAHAIEVSPVLVDLETVGARSQSQITIRNTGEAEIAIELVASQRSQNPDGTVASTPADDQFIVFPLQARVPGGKSQVFRIQYVGEGVDKSTPFTMSVQQLPVQFPDQFTGVQFLFNFNVAVWVSPQNATANLRIVEASGTTLPDGRPGAAIVIENSGNGYGTITSRSMRISGGGAEVEVPSRDLIDALGETAIPPGVTRRAVVPVSKSVGTGTVSATMTGP